MAKGTFEINEAVSTPIAGTHGTNSKRDSRAACTILVFLAICVLIISTTVTWAASVNKKTGQENYTQENTTLLVNNTVTEDITKPQMLESTTKETSKREDQTKNTTEAETVATFSTLPDAGPISNKIKSSTEATVDKQINPNIGLGNDEQSSVCTTTSCNNVASRILSWMDHSASPCDDFYEFTCGNVASEKDREDVDLLSSHLIKGETPKFINDFHAFYKSCVDYENVYRYSQRTEKVKKIVQEVGSFQFGAQAKPTYSTTELFSKLILLKSMPFMDIELDVDEDTSKYIFKLTLPLKSADLPHWSSLQDNKLHCLRQLEEQTKGLQVDLTSTYKKFLICQKDYTSILDSIGNSLREIRIVSNFTDEESSKHIENIKTSLRNDVFHNIDKLPDQATVKEADVIKDFLLLSVSDLQGQYPLLQWKDLFKTLAGHEIEDTTPVQVYYGQYFTQLFKDLSAPKVDVNDALLSLLTHSLYETTVLPTFRNSRKHFCLDLSKSLMPDVVNYLYKMAYTSDILNNHKKEIFELFNQLKNTFTTSITKADWLDAHSRSDILNKLNKLKVVSFDKDGVEEEKNKLQAGYRDLHIKDGEYQGNLILLMRNKRNSVYSLEGTKATPDSLFRYFVNDHKSPVSFYTSDIISIPLGLSKIAASSLPGYIIMGQVGFHLAKEIARQFDPLGFTHSVKLSTSSTPTYSYLEETTREMLTLTSPRMFGHQNVTFSVNNGLSANERITENTAFRIVIDTFATYGNKKLLPWISSSFSREKIFFLTIAQEFCKRTTLMDFMIEAFENQILPPQLRIENIMSNSDAFSDTFRCPVGSGMTLIEEKLEFPYLNKVEDEESDDM